MINITKKMARLTEELSALKDQITQAEKDGNEELVKKLKAEGQAISAEIQILGSYPTPEQILTDEVETDPRVPNSIDVNGQAWFGNIDPKDVYNFPVFVVNEDGDSILTTVGNAFNEDKKDELINLKESLLRAHEAKSFTYDLFEKGKVYTAEDDMIGDGYGFAAAPFAEIADPCDDRHIHGVNCSDSKYTPNRYFLKKRLAVKGFGFGVNGKSVEMNMDYSLQSIKIGDQEVVASVTFDQGGYIPGKGDKLDAHGYEYQTSSDDINSAIVILKAEIKDLDRNFELFTAKNQTLSDTLSDYVAAKKAETEGYTLEKKKAIEAETKSLADMDAAPNEGGAIRHSEVAAKMLSDVYKFTGEIAQNEVEITNAEDEQVESTKAGAESEAIIAAARAKGAKLVELWQGIAEEIQNWEDGEQLPPADDVDEKKVV
jgi:hypothetical protein